MEIVHGAKAQEVLPWERLTDAIHERAAGGAEIVGHHLARVDGARLAVCRQVVTAAEVREMRVKNSEVRSEHRRCDLAAVGAVADKGAG